MHGPPASNKQLQEQDNESMKVHVSILVNSVGVTFRSSSYSFKASAIVYICARNIVQEDSIPLVHSPRYANRGTLKTNYAKGKEAAD